MMRLPLPVPLRVNRSAASRRVRARANVWTWAMSCWCRPATSSRLDGEVIDGVAEVDESAVTGESAPVIRESGGDRSAVFGGTRVLSDWLKVKVTADLGHGLFGQISELIAGTRRQGEPDRALAHPAAACAGGADRAAVRRPASPRIHHRLPALDLPALVIALFGAMLPTATAGLRSVIGIVGMGRLVGVNMVAKSGAAVEAAANVDTLLLDKTGTITLGDRSVEAISAVAGDRRAGSGGSRLLCFAERRDARGPIDRRLRREPLRASLGRRRGGRRPAVQRRDPDERSDPSRRHRAPQGRARRPSCGTLHVAAGRALQAIIEQIARSGGTPLAVSRDPDRHRGRSSP